MKIESSKQLKAVKESVKDGLSMNLLLKSPKESQSIYNRKIFLKNVGKWFENCLEKLKNGKRMQGQLFLAVGRGTVRAATY